MYRKSATFHLNEWKMRFLHLTTSCRLTIGLIHDKLYIVLCRSEGGQTMSVKCKKRSFHSFKVDVSLLRYIVFYCELGCDTSELHVSYISRACSSLVRQPYYIPNRFLLKISRLETILATKKGRWDGRSFYMDEYTLIFLFSRCIRCAQKRDCWESVRFASERSRVRIPLGP